jgi:hypothetical protein
VKRRACVGLVVLVGLAVRTGHPSSSTAALGAPHRRLSWPRSGVGSAADARKRTGAEVVVLKADRCRSLRQTACLFWGSFPRKCSWRVFFLTDDHRSGHGSSACMPGQIRPERCLPVCLGSSTAAWQHGSTRAFSRFHRCFRRR